tara:strand:+ start:192 stop:410 length:219 start_codon:yes stop_codon:yes gene_type:complete
MEYWIIGLLVVIAIVLIWIAYNTSPFEYQKQLEIEHNIKHGAKNMEYKKEVDERIKAITFGEVDKELGKEDQ